MFYVYDHRNSFRLDIWFATKIYFGEMKIDRWQRNKTNLFRVVSVDVSRTFWWSDKLTRSLTPSFCFARCCKLIMMTTNESSHYNWQFLFISIFLICAHVLRIYNQWSNILNEKMHSWLTELLKLFRLDSLVFYLSLSLPLVLTDC